MGQRILAIIDDNAVQEALRSSLADEGHEIQVTNSSEGIEERVLQGRPDLLLLDAELEQADGLLLCARLRGWTDVPIVMLLGPSRRRADPIIALRLGADDFMSKPFEPEELVARVEAVLRRSRDRVPNDELRFGDLLIDRPGHRVLVGSNPLNLTPTEYNLLSHLATEPERVFTREELAKEVWGYNELGQSRIADIHVLRLRQKLAKAGVQVPSIDTVRGFGYKLSISNGNGAGTRRYRE